MDIYLADRRQIDPSEWDAFVLDSPQGNIYHCHAYLSNLMPRWQAVLLRDGDGLVAAMPFEVHSKWGVQYAIQPYFAQYIGILFHPKTDNVYKNLEFQKKAVQQLLEALPAALKYVDYHFAPEFEYDLALIWQGWQHRLLVTYWVDIRGGYASFLSECASHVRREVKKAAQAGLVVRVENNPELVVEILRTAKPKAVRDIPGFYFEALCKNARHFFPEGKSRCLIAYDGARAVAGIIYFFFRGKMIYYQGSTLPEYKASGAMSLIITEGVRLFDGSYEILDFDGSMIEPIERFYRGFGAFPKRYAGFRLNRLGSLPRLAFRLRQWWKMRS